MIESLHKFKKGQFLRWSCCYAIKSEEKNFKFFENKT